MPENTNNGSLHTTHVVIDGKLVPFTLEIARQFALNAHLLALGDPKRAAEMVAEAELAERRPAAA